MVDKTEQKILDVALKEFAKEGYVGARTKSIAEKSGFSEMTLFRKFKTKENLFNMVLAKNQEIVIKDFYLMMKDSNIDNPDDYLKTIIERLISLTEDNFDFISIVIYEKKTISGTVIAELMTHITECLEKIFPNSKIDTKVFVFNLLSFVYFLIFDKSQGRTFVDHKKAVEEFIKYSTGCLKL